MKSILRPIYLSDSIDKSSIKTGPFVLYAGKALPNGPNGDKLANGQNVVGYGKMDYYVVNPYTQERVLGPDFPRQNTLLLSKNQKFKFVLLPDGNAQIWKGNFFEDGNDMPGTSSIKIYDLFSIGGKNTTYDNYYGSGNWRQRYSLAITETGAKIHATLDNLDDVNYTPGQKPKAFWLYDIATWPRKLETVGPVQMQINDDGSISFSQNGIEFKRINKPGDEEKRQSQIQQQGKGPSTSTNQNTNNNTNSDATNNKNDFFPLLLLFPIAYFLFKK